MGKVQPVDRTVLPIPDPNFGGTIGRTMDASVADWTINMMPSPPDGAPNVLLVLIDDAGFGNPSTFGGPVSTPAMTRVAEQGLSYNRFHVTAICSPTRAALLAGRNHHTVGFGRSAKSSVCFPVIRRAYRRNAHRSSARCRVTATQPPGSASTNPDHVQGVAGLFIRWPNAWG